MPRMAAFNAMGPPAGPGAAHRRREDGEDGADQVDLGDDGGADLLSEAEETSLPKHRREAAERRPRGGREAD